MDLQVRRAGAVGALAAVLLLAGCSASGDHASSSAAVADAKGGAQAPGAAAATPGKGDAPAGAGAGGAAGTATAAATDRQIAYQAKLTLRVENVGDASAKAVDLVTRAGGYVAGEDLRGGTGDSTQSTLTLKVPSAAYQATLDGLGGLGTRLGLSSQAEDLTAQIADTDSRVKSMQASVDRVRALMADAKSLAEVVSLESELTRRESDLESLQHQQQQLAARTSLSTVTLDLVTARQAVRVEPEKKQTGFWASVGHALSGGWHALVVLVRALLMVLAALAPFLLVLAPFAWLLRRQLRKRPRTPRGPVRRAPHTPHAPMPPAPPRPTHTPDGEE
ncbi:DUF4349 domain-containing protein [Kitasatospora fiedleri]|uniref:DUF4349 domain-containing protein n=1 Tax=Kitasatospora fiedleri TaxID=2991545 RepID=UPI002499EE18|nr:DUF4349 domain-containing protein [Kitasatospora fiedleri]